MKNRGLRLAARWGASVVGFVLGAALNAIAAAMILSRLALGDEWTVLVTIVVIPAGAVVCSGMARRWADRYFEGRE